MTAVAGSPAVPVLEVERIRRDFPILATRVNGRPLVYLDNAATTQKPVQVIDALAKYYQEANANIHRGVHRLSELATAAYEDAREDLRRFFGIESADQIVFTRGTTEAINLVAQAYARPRLAAGDEILVSEMEHHSNIIPWQLLTQETGAVLKVIPVDEQGVRANVAGLRPKDWSNVTEYGAPRKAVGTVAGLTLMVGHVTTSV